MSIRGLIVGAAAVGAVGLALGMLAPPGPAEPAVPGAQRAPAAMVADPALSPAGPPADGPRSVRYDWPVQPPPPVVRGFEPPPQVWAPGHRGVDLGAVAGAPVYAAADGVVAFAGRVVDRTVVSIDHADGIRTTYEPLDPVVVAGVRVRAGTLIGHLSAFDDGPHCATDCLHWGARVGTGDYLDPLLLVGQDPVVIRLYPLPGSAPGG